MHLDYRCYILFRDRELWRKELKKLSIEASDGEEYTFLEIGRIFANPRRMISMIREPVVNIFDTVQSAEDEGYYFIHDHKKPERFFVDLTQYIFETLLEDAAGEFLLIADLTNFDDDSMGDHVYCYLGDGAEELQRFVEEDMDLHDVEISEVEQMLANFPLSEAQKRAIARITGE